MLTAILRKEFMALFGDRAGLFQLLLFPLITISLFSFLLSNSGFDGMRIAVIDQAGNGAAASVLDRLTEGNLEPILLSSAEMDRAITRGTLLVGILLPASYPDEPAQLFLSPTQSGVSRSLGRFLETALAGAGSGEIPATAGAPEGTMANLLDINWGTSGGRAEPVNTAAAGYVILSLFFIVVQLGRGLLMEQTTGVFRRLQGTPVTGAVLFVGKWLPAWFISLLQALVFLSFASLVLKLDLGSAVTLVPTILAISACASALGLWVGAFGKSESQVTATGVGLSLSLAALGGCFAPLYLLPHWLQTASWVIPQHWALVALQQGIAYEGGLWMVLPYLGILAAFTLLFAVLGARQFGAVLRRG